MDCIKYSIDLHIVIFAISQQKKDKAVGPDGMPTEAFIFGGSRLAIHICILFNLFLCHSFLPDEFMASVITPIVKCKCGDLGDTNNFRAITLSNAVTKILESVILDHISELSIHTNNQFGFNMATLPLCVPVLTHLDKSLIIIVTEVVMFLYVLLIFPKLSIE